MAVKSTKRPLIFICPACGSSKTSKCSWSGEIGEDDEYQGWWIECLNCGLQGPKAVWEHMARRRQDIEAALGLKGHDKAYMEAIESFGQKMFRELKVNDPQKGNFLDWVPSKCQAISEVEHHVIKLVTSINAGNKHDVTEYCADLANNAMAIDRHLGAK